METSQSRNTLFDVIWAVSGSINLAVPGIDVNAKHKDGRTALMMADNAEIARAIARAIRKRPRELHWVVSESKRQKYDIVDGVEAMMNLG